MGRCVKMGKVYHRVWRIIAALLPAGAALWLLGTTPRRELPLWPGARYTVAQRDRAIERGMDFLYHRMACNPEYFKRWGGDMLSAFYNIYATSSNPRLRRMAWDMGHERAAEWRRIYPSLPADADAWFIADMVFGTDSAERLGVPDSRMRAQLLAAAPRWTPRDYMNWDPAHEPPPRDLPELCSVCKEQNERGAITCKHCGAALKMRSRYDLYQDALITAYTGETAGIRLGVPYAAVLQWFRTLRPYPKWPQAGAAEYYAGIYSATHLIYTYNHYSRYRVSRHCFPDEFAHLRDNLHQAIADQDPESVGEFLDSLRAFGLDFSDEHIRAGFDYLMSMQNGDGSWGDVTDPDPYSRYHPTWTAIDGLRDYAWTQVLPCPP
jgi:hypothetical protein